MGLKTKGAPSWWWWRRNAKPRTANDCEDSALRLKDTTVRVKVEEDDRVNFGSPLSKLGSDEGEENGMKDVEAEDEGKLASGIGIGCFIRTAHG